MSNWKIYTPDGFQDILPEDCYLKKNLEKNMRQLFRSCGYSEVETPMIEFYDAFSSEKGLIPQETMFKFLINKGVYLF